MSSDIHIQEVSKQLDINIGHTYTNILLIDNHVRDYQTIVDSVNVSTLPIVYSANSSKADILVLLQSHFTTIDRIGVIVITFYPITYIRLYVIIRYQDKCICRWFIPLKCI